ncbi:hypothetical protein FJV41_05545 [Myxococcus llanfairpwllgwyngyllgogerychwyrndrobwllllantysiliogogogochensis]|uniref:Immunity MXAN-0049 protein domain-containing protein n=1 Tax=Myxococcus llanfairpwllgwyngyllgogerychwyrndrobwllllantysiliogogogochensis TaxID=2590453 RepID=A0A540X742_9BACT|nr:DUF1629 domain-containing protein [Myxococcus llanfairpwllgwyngyllgogerychwyrndrobwllllantysiliogogogochensis]TQF17032.1 hypothetical protein FJV41_05545 [Myxococcus llanfairpwllgwyngyllgogerychwyrndrobwllllantysiliogogogochensis]
MRGGNWDLGDSLDERGFQVDDPHAFRAGHPIPSPGRLSVPIEEPGRRLDFSTAGLGMAPVVHIRVATVFAELAPSDVQLIPVEIQGDLDQYLILVVTRLIRCIDDEASDEVRYWKPEDGQPERVGDYKSVIGMRIDSTKVGDAQVFRTWGWDLGLIVSEDIKAALERERTTGAKFTEV